MTERDTTEPTLNAPARISAANATAGATVADARDIERWRWGVAGLAVVFVVAAAIWTDAGNRGQAAADRIIVASFAVFASGVGFLFVLFVVLAILGRIDLPKVFEDKENLPASDAEEEREPRFVRAVAGRGAISLSRLQAFLWTLVVMTLYFHRAVTEHDGSLPSLPPEVLLLMGISGSVYLAGKHLSAAKRPGDAPAPSAGVGDGSKPSGGS